MRFAGAFAQRTAFSDSDIDCQPYLITSFTCWCAACEFDRFCSFCRHLPKPDLYTNRNPTERNSAYCDNSIRPDEVEHPAPTQQVRKPQKTSVYMHGCGPGKPRVTVSLPRGSIYMLPLWSWAPKDHPHQGSGGPNSITVR